MRSPVREHVLDSPAARRRLPADERGFLEALAGPTLFRLSGRDASRVRVVSTLLHGNEPSGLRALLRYLHSTERPATDVLVFLGAVETARTQPLLSHRSLPNRIDANRCWAPPWETPEGRVARDVLGRLDAASPESLVDLHNNTGHNPAYGVAFRMGPAEESLVSLFADRIVHTPIELGTLVEATVDRFPSVTVECGRAGDPIADEVAWRGLVRYLGQDVIDWSRPARPLMHLERPVRVCVRAGVDLDFGDGAHSRVPFTVSADIDRHNFERLPAGSTIGWLRPGSDWPIEAFEHDGRECSLDYFEVVSGELRTRRDFIPIMMTTSRVIAKSDCLFYAVQRAPSTSRTREAPAPPGGRDATPQ